MPHPAQEPSQPPTGEVPPSFEGVNPADLEALAAAGWGEGDDDDAGLPAGYWEPGR